MTAGQLTGTAHVQSFGGQLIRIMPPAISRAPHVPPALCPPLCTASRVMRSELTHMLPSGEASGRYSGTRVGLQRWQQSSRAGWQVQRSAVKIRAGAQGKPRAGRGQLVLEGAGASSLLSGGRGGGRARALRRGRGPPSLLAQARQLSLVPASEHHSDGAGERAAGGSTRAGERAPDGCCQGAAQAGAQRRAPRPANHTNRSELGSLVDQELGVVQHAGLVLRR